MLNNVFNFCFAIKTLVLQRNLSLHWDNGIYLLSIDKYTYINVHNDGS